MRLVLGGLQIYRPRSRRQDVLTLRRGRPQGNRVCRECHNDFRSMGGVRRFQATLCRGPSVSDSNDYPLTPCKAVL